MLGDCYSCAYREIVGCRDKMCGDALALINSQEQRIKELTEERNKVSEKGAEILGRLEESYLKLEGENIRLTEENERLMREKTALECVVATARNQAKADTVRKMQERLTEEFKDWLGIPYIIDKIAKEMLEEK